LVYVLALGPDLFGAKVGEHLLKHQLVFAQSKVHTVPPLGSLVRREALQLPNTPNQGVRRGTAHS
jgi:hypothetical protein